MYELLPQRDFLGIAQVSRPLGGAVVLTSPSTVCETLFPFNKLPPEIRARIWELTVEPRTVEVNLSKRDWRSEDEGNRLFSTTPVPAPLQTCREARNMGLYKKAFSEVGSEPRYVWVNLDIDMIFLGSNCHLTSFKAVAPSIKRLKFQRENHDEWWYHFESKNIRNFINAEEIHVVCGAGWDDWWGATEEHSWPCAAENIFFIDEEDGLMMDGIELERRCEEEHEARERRIRDEEDEDTRLELEDMVPL
ncbi:hypothetical protein V492_06642 [Pseudogymnoascus sp. VKM F-4246]|nr:hypothetical protein V492_06642 [Pseudogymnoascus sp. VKM F-4246]